MNRRAFLCTSLSGAFSLSASAHTPYRQWTIYRKRHLIIVTSRTDGLSYPLGQRVAKVLAARLPTSKARVARAPDTARIASLISTQQMDVALMRREDADALMHGRAPFADRGPIPLRIIIGLGDHVLVCRDDFPDLHAYLLAETLSKHGDEIGLVVPIVPSDILPSDAGVPTHSGAAAYFAGRPPPPRASPTP